MRLIKEQLNWGKKSELKAEVLRGIKEIGSALYWIGLLDIALVSALTFSCLKFECHPAESFMYLCMRMLNACKTCSVVPLVF